MTIHYVMLAQYIHKNDLTYHNVYFTCVDSSQ